VCVCVFARPKASGSAAPTGAGFVCSLFLPPLDDRRPSPSTPPKKKNLEFWKVGVRFFLLIIITHEEANQTKRNEQNTAGQRARTAQGDHGGIQGGDQTCK